MKFPAVRTCGRVAHALIVLAMLVLARMANAQVLVVDGSSSDANVRVKNLAGINRYSHVCVINGGVVNVLPYNGDKGTGGNLELIASTIYVDKTSRIDARGAGYVTNKCYHGNGPTDVAGGRGGCAVRDSGGGGAHFGRGGRGTVDDPSTFDTHFEDNCDACSTTSTTQCNTSGTHTWDPAANSGNGACTSTADCGSDYLPAGATDANMDGCPDKTATDTGYYCKLGPSVAGQSYWHGIYEREFGAAGGDKGCRDGDGRRLVTGGNGGGRVVLVGLADRVLGGPDQAPVECGGTRLAKGHVQIDGTIDAGGKRGCGDENDSGGGGAGGSVLVVGDDVVIKASARISAAGGLGGDVRAANPTSPNYTDCPNNSQGGPNYPGGASGSCDDCGGGGGGGIISVLSVSRDLQPGPKTQFNVGGAVGGTCDVCKGEAGGGAGELQLDGAYTGEFCDGFDNDFDGQIDENLGTQTCGLGSCQATIPACENGKPRSCVPDTSKGDCKAPPQNARPRVAVIVDTSASMLLDLKGFPTFGDGSVEHEGLGTVDITKPVDSRLYLAREALGQVMSAYPEIDFALARYHQDQGENRSCQSAFWFECQGLVATYDDPTDNSAYTPVDVTVPNGDKTCSVSLGTTVGARTVLQVPGPNQDSTTECINYAGSCGAPRRGADVLSGFGTPVRDMVRWLDGVESKFNPSTKPGDYCLHSEGNDCELRGSGPTPLSGALQSIEDYVTPIRATDANGCRQYNVILVTDGVESCGGDPIAAATQLNAKSIKTSVVAVSVLPSEEAALNALAAAGGTTEATFVRMPEQLVPALTKIIAGSIRTEKCNGEDDDCDGRIDEDFPGLGTACDDHKKGICRGEGTISCIMTEPGKGTGTECAITSPGKPPTDEVCNGFDDNCNGTIDEGLDCELVNCPDKRRDVCDGVDNNCNGVIDEDDPLSGTPCGKDEGECTKGTLTCVLGMLRCSREVGPQTEQCNGRDDDCDSVIDNDAPCPVGTQCLEGACRNTCGGLEFGCPVGLECIHSDKYSDDFCLPRECALCRSTEVCENDKCVDPCTKITCDNGLICVRGQCRDCSVTGCPRGQACYEHMCQENACTNSSCAAGTFCFKGDCIKQCADSQCPSGQTCNADGECAADACVGKMCVSGETCREGSCVEDVCQTGTGCPTGELCTTQNGCITNPCAVTKCPNGSLCTPDSATGAPRCTSAEPPAPPAVKPTYVSTGGSGLTSSCSVGTLGAADGRARGAAGWFLLGLALWQLLRRRRVGNRAQSQLAVPVACLALCGWLAGCDTRAICLDCVELDASSTNRDAEASDNDGGGGGTSGRDGSLDSDGGPYSNDTPPTGCEVLGDEVCNRLDDDCDGNIDEDFDFANNVRHCGQCDHACSSENAQTECRAGECRLTSCLAGFIDLDQKLGCEYRCPVFPTTAEDCNGYDDDCDGRIDEEITAPSASVVGCRRLANTPCANVKVKCAKLANSNNITWVCDYPSSVEFDPALPDGIRQQETLCDGQDNDCDGVVDDPWPELGEPCDDGKVGACRNGGSVVCSANHAEAKCDLSLPPDALPGAGPGATELCNDLDDDCDGIVDNSEPTASNRIVDDMVHINFSGHNFWIYKYEASRPDSSMAGAGIVPSRSCSKPLVKPWTFVSYAAAEAACFAAGKKHLCTGDEWRWACENNPAKAYPYGDQYAKDSCNGADHDLQSGGAIDNGVIATGSMDTCVTPTGVLDMSGNVKEWVDQDGAVDGNHVVRGGSFESPRLGLTCQTTLSQADGSTVLAGLGFRCCSATAP